jgi:hypothetical protein
MSITAQSFPTIRKAAQAGRNGVVPTGGHRRCARADVHINGKSQAFTWDPLW